MQHVQLAVCCKTAELWGCGDAWDCCSTDVVLRARSTVSCVIASSPASDRDEFRDADEIVGDGAENRQQHDECRDVGILRMVPCSLPQPNMIRSSRGVIAISHCQYIGLFVRQWRCAAVCQSSPARNARPTGPSCLPALVRWDFACAEGPPVGWPRGGPGERVRRRSIRPSA